MLFNSSESVEQWYLTLLQLLNLQNFEVRQIYLDLIFTFNLICGSVDRNSNDFFDFGANPIDTLFNGLKADTTWLKKYDQEFFPS